MSDDEEHAEDWRVAFMFDLIEAYAERFGPPYPPEFKKARKLDPARYREAISKGRRARLGIS